VTYPLFVPVILLLLCMKCGRGAEFGVILQRFFISIGYVALNIITIVWILNWKPSWKEAVAATVVYHPTRFWRERTKLQNNLVRISSPQFNIRTHCIPNMGQ
jgi:hypothetical protein